MTMNQAPEVIYDLLHAIIVTTMSDYDWEWSMISVVIELDGSELAEAYGYTYGEKIEAIGLEALGIHVETFDYLETHLKRGGVMPRKILVQFDRATGEYEITFENTRKSRWKITPQNVYSIREELRPRLG